MFQFSQKLHQFYSPINPDPLPVVQFKKTLFQPNVYRRIPANGENCSRTKLFQLKAVSNIFRFFRETGKQTNYSLPLDQPLITFGNIDVDAGRLRVGRPAGVVTAVADLRLLNN